VGVLKTVLTGGSGRFGAVVAKLLAGQGHEILLLDRQPPKDELPAGVRFEANDLGDAAVLRSLFAGFERVVHLAAIPNPLHHPPETVFANNVVTTYNVLLAAAETGVTKICLASSINAIGGAWSRRARYDYLPVDEAHPSYNEDAYSLSKWVGEAQADSIARRYAGLTISSLRLHGLNKRLERTDASLAGIPAESRHRVVNHLWGYVDIESAAKAVALSLRATFTGHEAFFIVAPRTVFLPEIASRDLAARHYPGVPLHAALHENAGFYDCAKSERLLGWRHKDL
jgi:UDP-glucose 4-epimerase